VKGCRYEQSRWFRIARVHVGNLDSRGKEKMREEPEAKSYKSPQRKLVRFFEKSRNQWKAKCHKAKSKVKQLKNKVRFLEESRQQWKSRTKELERELAQVKAKEQTREREEKELKKSPRKEPWLKEDGLKNLVLLLFIISTPLAISFFLYH
jgi:chromosome segregation ATPase